MYFSFLPKETVVVNRGNLFMKHSRGRFYFLLKETVITLQQGECYQCASVTRGSGVIFRSNLCRSQLELKEVTCIGSSPAFVEVSSGNRGNPIRKWATSVPLSHRVAKRLLFSIKETEAVSKQRLSVLWHLNVLSSTLGQPYTPSNLCFYFQRNRGHK